MQLKINKHIDIKTKQNNKQKHSLLTWPSPLPHMAQLYFVPAQVRIRPLNSYCDQVAWGKESWSMCFSCVCLFIFHALIFVLFLFLFESGVGCGLWLWHFLDFSINIFYQVCF